MRTFSAVSEGTVEPLNKGHFGSSHTVLYIEVVLCSEAEKHCNHNIGVDKGVHYWEVVPCSEGPLLEVPLYVSLSQLSESVGSVPPSLLHPLTGSNGQDFMFLLKGHEDLRQDERVMQLFGLVNTLLANDPETFKRHLRYSLIRIHSTSLVYMKTHANIASERTVTPADFIPAYDCHIGYTVVWSVLS